MKKLHRNLKFAVKTWLNRLGLRVFFSKSLSHGLGFFDDIKRAFPFYRLDKVVDVGANIGQIYEKLRGHDFGHLYCLEPVGENFTRLLLNIPEDSRVTCLKYALDNCCGSATIHLSKNPLMHSLIAASSGVGRTEMVNTITLETLAETHNLEHLSLLKVDAEGADMRVLEGARSMLGSMSIDFVQLELSFSPENLDHASFESASALMHGFGYRVFGVYCKRSA